MVATGLEDLATTGHLFLDSYLIRIFVERSHGETFSFHMPAGEITVTLDVVSYLLHLPNKSRLLDQKALTRAEGEALMVELLGSDLVDAARRCMSPKWAHARTTYLHAHFKSLLEHVAHNNTERDKIAAWTHQIFAVRPYLLLVVGFTIFADTSKNCVHIFYLNYFRDLETVFDYVWGPAVLTFLYRDLPATTTPRVTKFI
jgi:hypothetical protein